MNMMDKEAEKFFLENRTKKLYKVHVTLEVKGQFTVRYLDTVVSVLADNEEQARTIARGTKCKVSSLGKTKLEYDFGKNKQAN